MYHTRITHPIVLALSLTYISAFHLGLPFSIHRRRLQSKHINLLPSTRLQSSIKPIHDTQLTYQKHDSWSFTQRSTTNGISNGLYESIQQAFSEVPPGTLPNVLIMQYSSVVSRSFTRNASLRVIDYILSYLPSINIMLGVVIDDPYHQNDISITLGCLPDNSIKGFHIDDSEHLNQNMLLNSSSQSILLFPHSSTPIDLINSFVAPMVDKSPDSIVIGSLLSANVDDNTPSGFLVERGYPDSKITHVTSGIVGLTSTSDLSPIQKLWPAWQHSLLPMLRWANHLGH